MDTPGSLPRYGIAYCVSLEFYLEPVFKYIAYSQGCQRGNPRRIPEPISAIMKQCVSTMATVDIRHDIFVSCSFDRRQSCNNIQWRARVPSLEEAQRLEGES